MLDIASNTYGNRPKRYSKVYHAFQRYQMGRYGCKIWMDTNRAGSDTSYIGYTCISVGDINMYWDEYSGKNIFEVGDKIIFHKGGYGIHTATISTVKIEYDDGERDYYIKYTIKSDEWFDGLELYVGIIPYSSKIYKKLELLMSERNRINNSINSIISDKKYPNTKTVLQSKLWEGTYHSKKK